MNKNVFLSYCWKDEEVTNRIDNYFKSRGFILKKDKREVQSWKSIKSFMKEIRNSSYAILVISDSYLKSPNCMYEVLEVMKDESYRKRILTVVLSGANIYNPLGKANYIQYWKEKYNGLKRQIEKIDHPESTIDLTKELKKTNEIKSNIGEFMALVSDINNPSIEDVCEEIKKKLINKGFEIEDEVDGLEAFLNELDKCVYMQTSIYPEHPQGEKKYKFKGSNVSKGIHGINIEFTLKSDEDDESIKLCVIDIVEIEKNSIESFKHKKFYMWCKDRVKENEYNEYMSMKEYGIVNDSNKEFELIQQIRYCHRFILWY